VGGKKTNGEEGAKVIKGGQVVQKRGVSKTGGWGAKGGETVN